MPVLHGRRSWAGQARPGSSRAAAKPSPAARRNQLVVAAAGSAGGATAALEATFAAPAAFPARPPLPAILCAPSHASPEDLAAVVQEQLAMGAAGALVSHAEPETYAALRKFVPGVQYHARAKMLICKPQAGAKQPRLPGTVCIVSAGQPDQAAADQVSLACQHLGCYCTRKAGLTLQDLPKLCNEASALQAADVVVVIAGADSSLPAAIAGICEVPVIAVPISAGPTATSGLQGLGNLVAAVNSAAAGVSVVPVDGAVSAAVMAARVLRTAAVRVDRLLAAQAAAVAAPAAGAAAANNVVRLGSQHAPQAAGALA